MLAAIVLVFALSSASGPDASVLLVFGSPLDRGRVGFFTMAVRFVF